MPESVLRPAPVRATTRRPRNSAAAVSASVNGALTVPPRGVAARIEGAAAPVTPTTVPGVLALFVDGGVDVRRLATAVGRLAMLAKGQQREQQHRHHAGADQGGGGPCRQVAGG